MTNIDAAGPAQSSATSQAEDTAPLARDFQDLLTSGKGGAPAMITITLAQGGGTASGQPAAFAKPIVITAVNGHDQLPGGPGGLEAGAGSALGGALGSALGSALGGGSIVITAVHGEQPTALPDAVQPGMTTITAVRDGSASEHGPDFRMITVMHGGEQPTALPDASGPRMTTITAVRDGGASEHRPDFRVITMVHGGEQPTALPDASGPRMVTITAVRGDGAPHGLPALRVITMVHGGDHATALPDAAIPRTITITVVNKPE